MSTLTSVTDSSFETDVLQSTLPVLVDYWAEWCGPCRMLSPILEEIAKDYEGKIKILKLDVDQNPTTAAKFGIRGIPTLMLYKNGKMIASKSGFLSKAQLSEFINSHLG